MKNELLLAEAARSAWAIEPAFGGRMARILARWARGENAAEDDLQDAKATREARAARRQSGNGARSGGIAVLPLHGVIAPKASLITDFSGGTSCQAFTALLAEAVADPAVQQIVLDVDSPGGSVAGVQETASEIMQARTQKPVVAIANHQAASAAYWLASCATELYVSPSGEVGSIGVYTMHQDISEALAKDGVKNTLVSAGKYKVEGSPYAPLAPEAKAYMQATVDQYYGAFVAAVARGRGVSVDKVRSGFGQGRMLTAEAALTCGMVDGIKSISDLVRDMQARPRTTRPARHTALAGRSVQANRNTLALLTIS